MIVLIGQKTNPPEGYIHEATDWELWEGLPEADGSTRVFESSNNTINKRIILADVTLDLNKEYYSRIRELYGISGWSQWSNVDKVEIHDLDETRLITHMPSGVSVPNITTSYSPDTHPSTNFYIETELYGSVGNSIHESSSYVITDLYGKVMWANLHNKTDLNKKYVDIILPVNRAYMVYASHKGTNGSVSQYGSKVIYVSDDIRLPTTRVLRGVTNTDDLLLNLHDVVGLDKIEWELFDNGTSLLSGSTIDTYVTIPTETLDYNNYTLSIRLTIDSVVGEWTHMYMEPMDPNYVRPGDDIPYLDREEVDDGVLGVFPIEFPS